jgi:hypothetical protein
MIGSTTEGGHLMTKREYGLTHLVLGSPPFVPITREDYTRICEAKTQLLECLLLEDGFDLVVENYLELETTLLQSSVRDVLGDPPFEQRSHDDINLFNRRFANLMTVCKMYRDQAPARLKRLFPENRNKKDEVVARFDALRDQRLGYLVTEVLRNYVQHAGFPVDGVTYGHSRVGPPGSGGIRTTIAPSVSVDTLLKDRRITQDERQRLEQQGCDRLDLRDMVRDYVEGLAGIHEGIRSELLSKIDMWQSVLQEAWSRYRSVDQENGGRPGLSAVIRDHEGLVLENTELPRHPQQSRRHLERKNGNLGNLRSVFVSSEVCQ